MENLFRDEQKKVKKRKKVAKSTLSFAVDDDEGDGADTPSSRGEDGDGDDEKPAKRPKSRKNPNVDTSFLPDREREEEERSTNLPPGLIDHGNTCFMNSTLQGVRALCLISLWLTEIGFSLLRHLCYTLSSTS